MLSISGRRTAVLFSTPNAEEREVNPGGDSGRM